MKFTSYNMFLRDLYRGGIDYAASRAAAEGYSGVEFLDFCGTREPLDKEKYPAEEVRHALVANNLTVDCYSVYANVLCEDSEYFDAEMRRQIDYAAAIGAKILHHTLIPSLTISENAPKYDDVFDFVVEKERRIADYCREKGMECIYEAQGFYFNGIDGVKRLITALCENAPNVGYCADLGNPLFADCDPVDITRELAQYIRHVHIKDYNIYNEPTGRKGELRSRGGKYLCEALPREGMIDLAECLRIIKASGYEGRAAFEFFADDEKLREIMQYLTEIWER